MDLLIKKSKVGLKIKLGFNIALNFFFNITNNANVTIKGFWDNQEEHTITFVEHDLFTNV